ncbi:hypothetical protein ACH5RR_000577 [Cinchona calisaya]|uniref:tRNA (guanine(46)-N(7))-methyltransferase n=1 Tax=Cinchona calisaya TaxID=153742 RepID=A0ABD3B191_9GENT
MQSATAMVAAFPATGVGRTILQLVSFSLQHRHRCFCTLHSPTTSAADLQSIRSPGLVALEYADLNLSDKFSEELGPVRIRQHVNPLRSSLIVPAEVPDWNEVYKDPTLPLMVDIGCGSGRFLMWLAKRNPNSSYLGLEIRQKLAERAKYWANELALNNIHFIFANATVSFKQLVSTYPGPLTLVSILCPDPHFKKKYHKRRVVQKPLVESIVDSLAPGGQEFRSLILEVETTFCPGAGNYKINGIERNIFFRFLFNLMCLKWQ